MTEAQQVIHQPVYDIRYLRLSLISSTGIRNKYLKFVEDLCRVPAKWLLCISHNFVICQTMRICGALDVSLTNDTLEFDCYLLPFSGIWQDVRVQCPMSICSMVDLCASMGISLWRRWNSRSQHRDARIE